MSKVIKNYVNNANAHEMGVPSNSLIGNTSFFRDPEAFKIIKNQIIPDIFKRKEPVKIWIAGCATGEEAYSIAILFKEYQEAKSVDVDIKIFATDIDYSALAAASNGIYGENIKENISKERLEKYFTADGNSYKINPDIRKMLVFARHDLSKNPPYCNVDLITCRNLLYNMDSELQQKVLSMLHFGLKKNGYLFLGMSENANGLKSSSIKEVNAKWKIYQNVTLNKTLPLNTITSFAIPDTESLLKVNEKLTALTKDKFAEELNQLLLSEYGYAAVSINEKYVVQQTFGEVNKYLLPKILQLNLIEVLPASLAMAFNKAVKEVLNTNQQVVIRKIRLKKENKVSWVDLFLKPFTNHSSNILVVFQDTRDDQSIDYNAPQFDERVYMSEYVTNLEEELRETKDDLKLVLSKLQLSNENIQLFSQELVSVNEEVQRAYAEIQSVNEELKALNADFQKRNEELVMLNDDLNNCFQSNINGQLLVDKNMLLKKFSPAAACLVNLIDSDIGRPIDHLTTKINYPILKKDINSVINTGKIITTEVESSKNKWYQLRIIPFINEKENIRSGAIITFNDITELKKIQLKLESSNKSLELINSDLDNFVYTASHDLMLPLNNIQSLTKLLTEAINKHTPDVKKYISMIYAATMRLKATLREMSDLGKIEAEIQMGKSSVNFHEALEDVKKQINDIIVSTKTKIKVKLDVKEVLFCKKNMRCILVNLISNAIKHKSPDRDPNILIHTQKVPGYTLLSVKDNGKGIKEKDLERIFGMYQRADHSAQGSGIGLYLLNKIMHAIGGKVEVDSEVGIGSTFKIFFKA